MWIGSQRKLHLLPNTPLRVVDSEVTPVSVIRDLGTYLNSDTSMTTQVSKTVGCCFGALRTIRAIKDSLPRKTLCRVISALVLSRLDYGNAVLFGVPDTLLMKYQAVLNAAARLVYNARGRDHVTPLLTDLHWLKARERISYKVACLTWRCVHDCGPTYLSDDVKLVSRSGRREGLRSSGSADLVPPRTRNVTHGDRAWPAAAATVWNSLKPKSLKLEEDYETFKRDLKSFLWSKSYPPIP